ncbi:MAG: sulfotransferase [Acidobacteria bacterium]|nr:sulfotransferase [Acidobacteriota bacterium]
MRTDVLPAGGTAALSQDATPRLRIARDCAREYWRARRAPRFTRADPVRLQHSLDVLARGGRTMLADDPVFLLASGWRTGSTLLQRVLVTDPALLMWGEPLGRMALLPRLAEMLAAVDDRWPTPESATLPQDPSGLATSWIANLYPGNGDLRQGLRALLDSWLAAPARRRGYVRWGVKEVRLGAAEACVLRWLYPAARFILLLRHPFDSYRSARNWRLYSRWPDETVDCAVAFARHWNRLAVSWNARTTGLDPLVIRYEDLVSGKFDFERLGNSLDLQLAPERALSSRPGVRRTRRELCSYERRLVVREAAAGMEAFGYLPDGSTAVWKQPGLPAQSGSTIHGEEPLKCPE